MIVTVAIFIFDNSKKLGNPRAIPLEYNFSCQKYNAAPYFSIPGSNKILSYDNGEISLLFNTKCSIYSIYDDDQTLILDGQNQYGDTCFTILNKKTGAEEEIMTFDEGEAWILNVMGGIIYYTTHPGFDLEDDLYWLDYRTYSYNIKTKEVKFITQGSSCVSTKGLYSVVGYEGGFQLWHNRLGKLSADNKKLIREYGSYSNSVLYWAPLILSDKWLYTYTIVDVYGRGVHSIDRVRQTWFVHDQMDDYQSNAIDGTPNVLNGYIYYIKRDNGAARFLCRRSTSEEAWDSSESIIVLLEGEPNDCFSLFKDPNNHNKTIIATYGDYDNTIAFWDENGNRITEYKGNN